VASRPIVSLSVEDENGEWATIVTDMTMDCRSSEEALPTAASATRHISC
jgi:hypothetical protein